MNVAGTVTAFAKKILVVECSFIHTWFARAAFIVSEDSVVNICRLHVFLQVLVLAKITKMSYVVAYIKHF